MRPYSEQTPDLGLCRRFIVADLIKRCLQQKGYKVTHIVNITDLDDKTIRGSADTGLSLSADTGLSLKVFTRKFTEAFLTDMDMLAIKRATHYPVPPTM